MESGMTTEGTLRRIYDRAFFAAQVDGSARSARIVVPMLLDLCPNVRSVVDVGCGAGVWLARFKEGGVEHVLGLDGGSAEDHGQLEISPDEFRSADFERELPTDTHFDLCLCLEVAEHLAPAAAPHLIRNLCRLSDVIAFSAALPGQGGTHHLNERWPSYWAGLFAEHGYRPLDIVRRHIWYDARIEWWYRQNIILFANFRGVQRIRNAEKYSEDQCTGPLDVVHPDCFSIYRAEVEWRSHTIAILQEEAAQEQLAAFAAKAQTLRDQRDSIADQLNVILNSTSWKLTFPLRRLFENSQKARYCLRRVAYFLWWSVTGQVINRLRDRRIRKTFQKQAARESSEFF